MKNRFVQTLRVRSFFFLWLAEVFSQVAANTLNFLLILIVFSQTNSNTAVSGIILCFSIPAILFAIPAGVLVDKKNKKTTLFITNLARSLFVLLLAFLHTNLFFVYGIFFIISVIMQFFIPAETPMIPVLIKKELLLSANALFGLALFGSVFVAYALSGPYLSLFGSFHGLLGIALLFAIGAIAVLFIKVPKKSKVIVSQKVTIMGEIHETLSLIVTIPKLYHAFSLLIISQILIFLIAVLGPGYAKNVLHIPINQFPVLFVMPAMLGIGVGTVLLTQVFHAAEKHKTGTYGLFITAATLLLLPYGSVLTSKSFIHSLNTVLPHILQINQLHIMTILAFIMGVANAFIFIPSNTIIQEETREGMRGKIYGALNALTSALSLLPVIIAGSLADIFGVQTVLIVLGISVGVLALVRLFIPML